MKKREKAVNPYVIIAFFFCFVIFLGGYLITNYSLQQLKVTSYETVNYQITTKLGIQAELFLLAKADAIFQNLMHKEWSQLASKPHYDKGLIYSPFANIGAEDDLFFSVKDIEDFNNNEKEYRWSWDQSGREYFATPNEWVDEFLAVHKFNPDYQLTYDQISYNDSIVDGGGSQPNTIPEVFPDAIYIEYYHEPDEDDWHYWQALRFVFEQINDEWYLIAIVRGAHNP
ncbi:hypothetical protein SAMN04488134_101737 [Amphibacillus marinus]|uniref:Uncharacterized protein n=1 Tax=Amphibacillus marinus TaxID=872970 RepID=A0A1H8IUQ2_9BACI|nr:hypothetical protein [Amphibacillus marinus]SEN72373.1 hypothetical protein SAMN04488134_101737 [Amphibacillus marinus]